MLVIASGVALSFLMVALALASSKSGARGVAWLAAGDIVLGMCSGIFVSPLLMAQGFFTLVVALACSAVAARPRTLSVCTSLATALAFLIAIWIGASQLIEFHRARERFPLQSLADRLNYEERDGDHESSEIELSPVAQQRLARFEAAERPDSFRSYLLKRLHEKHYEDFVGTEGFGVGRMIRVTPRMLESPAVPPIILPKPCLPPDDPATELPQPFLANVTAPGAAQLTDLHDRGLLDFLDRQRMGYIESRQQAVGFQAHAFSEMPLLIGDRAQAESWQLVRLELVSLLKHAEPVAYVSEKLPRMDELKDAPTRPLDSFEAASLPRLTTDEDVVIDDAPRHIRMLGAIRAAQECLQCHSVRRGKLLGAFSYELVPTKPTTRPRQNSQPQKPEA